MSKKERNGAIECVVFGSKKANKAQISGKRGRQKVEIEWKKPGLMVIKLNKRGGNSTPYPTWKNESFDFQTNTTSICNLYNSINKDVTNLPNINTRRNSYLSARKLGARFWESLPPHTEKMSRRCRRPKGKEKGLKVGSQIDSPYEEPPRPSDSSLKREIAISLIKHHRTVERNSRALQTVSPASYYSSMEVIPFNPPLSPHSFRGLEGKNVNSRFDQKKSKELVQVLNRIWSLEEQHTSNTSLINSMKRELDQAHVRIKTLQREKNKDQEKVKAKIKSLREELEDERKLRKQSESLHMKLAKNLSDTKASFTQTLKEYEKVKNSRNLLESLCDEFSKGIRDYEQEVRHLKHKPDRGGTRESPDRLIVHLSEAWLDERMQMKHDEEKGTIVDKLNLEIETFLRAKGAKHAHNEAKLSSKKKMNRSLRRLSSESFHLNEATSHPRNAKKDDNSTSSDSNCVQSRLEEIPKLNTKKKVRSRNKQEKNGVENPRVNSNRMLYKLVKNHILSLEEETVKESTLKAKLLEARLEGQHSKAFGGSA